MEFVSYKCVHEIISIAMSMAISMTMAISMAMAISMTI
jgi:hypothetical protein